MHRILVLFLLFPLYTAAQLFQGSGGIIVNNGGTETTFTIPVTTSFAAHDSLFGLEEVCFTITHPAVQELHVILRSPSGTEVWLTGMKSCKGSNFYNTCLSQPELRSVTIGTAPYTGSFRPVGNLGRFNAGKNGNGAWQLVIKDFVGGGGSGTLESWSLRFGAAPARPVIFSSSSLPVIQINSPYKLTEVDVPIDLLVIDNGKQRNAVNNAVYSYKGRALCHVRGSSSRMFEKRNLKLELKTADGNGDTSAALCGMPADSDWILTACYADKTLLRNYLSHEIFRRMGHYTPRCRFAEVMINGEYAGVYMLMEQVKRGKSRVDVNKLSPEDEKFPDITGGYILQIDRVNVPGWYSLHPGVSANGARFFYQYNYPRAEIITPAQMHYIKSVLDTFETVMASQGFSDPQTGYRRIMETGSFVDYFILGELSKNVDAYKLSTYLYKDHAADGGRLHVGPVWDHDLAWHNANFGNAFDEREWQHVHNNSANPIPTWWRRLMEDSLFTDELYCRYSGLREGLLSESRLHALIDSLSVALSEARERNFRQFPILGAYIWPNPQGNDSTTSYESEIGDLKSWIVKRAAWLDGMIVGACPAVVASPLITQPVTPLVYPALFTDRLYIGTRGLQTGIVSLELFSADGSRIIARDYLVGDNSELLLQVPELPCGLYVLRVFDGNQVTHTKVVRVAGE
jgi:subtilisin-like proprotein convertase family protein